MDTITLPACAGGESILVDWESFPVHIQEALKLHGLQQKVADAVANAAAKGWDQTQSREACMAVIAALQAGTWARRGGGPRARDEEAFVIAALAAKIKAKARKAGEPIPDPITLRALAAAAVDKPSNAAIVTAARAEWRARHTEVDTD